MTSPETFTECWIHHNQSLCSLRSEFVRYLRCYNRISSRTKSSCYSTTPFARSSAQYHDLYSYAIALMTDIFGWLELISALQRSVVLLNVLWSPFSHHFKVCGTPKHPWMLRQMDYFTYAQTAHLSCALRPFVNKRHACSIFQFCQLIFDMKVQLWIEMDVGGRINE